MPRRLSMLLVVLALGGLLLAPLQTAAAPLRQSQIPDAEYQALLALYNSTNGATWTHNDGWLVSDTPCSWYGVSCSAGHVTELSLYNNNLWGTMPTQLGDLTSMTNLYLNDNHLTSTIPAELGNLASLQSLLLYANDLLGNIPPELGNLADLRHLNLHGNHLSGEIPPELAKLGSLQYLGLSQNEISGAIPSWFSKLADLQHLNLEDNQLSGTIPPTLGTLTNLTYLDLGANDLEHDIPPELGDLANLQYLNLYGNELSGEIPSTLANLAGLQHLWLSQNQLTGEIPPELGNLAQLENLDLYSNQLTGPIPSHLGNLAGLSDLYLNDNQLSGPIPPDLGKLTSLERLYIDHNGLTGPLPTSLVNLTHLAQFYFAYTNLCEPADAAFQAWLGTIDDLMGTSAVCDPSVLPPANVSASDGTYASEVRITWDAVPGATQYTVYRSEADDSDSAAPLGVTAAGYYDDTTAGVGTVYYYWVKGNTAIDFYIFSVGDAGYRGQPAPANVSASDSEFADKVHVSWDAAEGATSYVVYRATSNASRLAAVIGEPTTATWFDDTTVTPGRVYYYWVKARNDLDGVSAFSNRDSGFAQPDVPETPQDVSASEGTYVKRVHITWSAVPGATEYIIYRNTTEDSRTAQELAATTRTRYDDRTAAEGTEYWYWVAAKNAASQSELGPGGRGYWRQPRPPRGPHLR